MPRGRPKAGAGHDTGLGFLGDLAPLTDNGLDMIYLLNTPVLTAYGEFRFSGPLDPDAVRSRLMPGFVSAIGHDASAAFLSALLGIVVPTNRVAIMMDPGDTALVLRLKERLPEGILLNARELATVPYELGWLERLT